ncbi:hypothetical protein E4U60_005906 [Claviceps pazoutovae]|uniref:Hpc2-related domain-containing protein n=1 Tax=Claviceps pazoutovae TaxID=1649127 RepID=A0A9P7SJH5_9HYPO|nr:hypothetical protein E4U60_005906 [Claviceps pazoutovae]
MPHLAAVMNTGPKEIIVGDHPHGQPHGHPHGQPHGQPHGTNLMAFQQYHQPSPSSSVTGGRSNAAGKRFECIDGEWVQLTAAGLPRKKPGRKPGSAAKAKAAEVPEAAAKVRKPRKPRDPNAPPIQRKRKAVSASEGDGGDSDVSRVAAGPHQISNTCSPSQQHQQHRSSPKMPKREGFPGSMQSILNADVPPTSTSPSAVKSIPVRTSGLSYDPIRCNYDPVRGTHVTRVPNPYLPASVSPPGPAKVTVPVPSPSIASMIEPSPQHSQPSSSSNGRVQNRELPSRPPSPPYRPDPVPEACQTNVSRVSKENATTVTNITTVKATKTTPPPPAAPVQRPVVNHANFTTISNGPIKRASPKLKSTTGVNTPRVDTLDDLQEVEGRSILDFGKARPGEEFEAPTIVLHIPLKAGETNRYINFMRLAEDHYGWDALHPRLAANRDRKARIAAATASLEKDELRRVSGDEMSLDLSDGEASNPENGGTSGPDVPLKQKKKRNFKEDQYDVEDDFVDDSEMLWEAQAAASRDGFFVYSGPLVPEVEKPATPHERPKRGRGSRGGRGGRGGAAARGGATARGGGGPGSRGGSVTRKPRVTKAERLQREREKTERETLAQIARTSANGYALQTPATPAFSVTELGA